MYNNVSIAVFLLVLTQNHIEVESENIYIVTFLPKNHGRITCLQNE